MRITKVARWATAAVVAASMTAALGTSAVVADAGDRPISGTAHGGITGATEDGQLIFDYTGSASHLGQFTRREYVTLVGLDLSGTMDITAANGDVLHLSFTGQIVPPYDGHAEGTYTFDGGTGRFEDATGTADFTAYAPGFDFSDVSVTFEGTINY
jgi:hypothetical protein